VAPGARVVRPGADVVVVGGGPAGAMAAMTLAARGVSTLLLDKKRFPRDKPCGGGIRYGVLRRFPALADYLRTTVEIHEIRKVRMEGPSGASLLAESDEPFYLTLRRTEFDAALLARARAVGARVLEAVRVTDLLFSADGVANDLLRANILWTTEGFQAWLAVVIADTWKTAPFIGLLVLAGLQIIPAEVYEAAKVDGSSAWRTFWRITLPLVKPALVVAVLFRMLDVLRMFDLPFVLIGPQKKSTQTLSLLAYNDMSNLHFGPAAAYATVLFAYVAVVAYAFVRLLGADIVGRGVGGGR